MSDDWEEVDEPCSNCGNPVTRARDCMCDDGFIDRYEEDPLWYDPGDFEECPDCHGTGREWWCPKCSQDMNSRHATVAEREGGKM